MNQLDLDYQNLLKDILENGIEKNTRNGKVLSVFGRSIRYDFKDGKFPLITTKKMHFKSVVTELVWFLSGSTNIQYLVQNGCHIWDGDCYKAFHSKFPETEMMSKEDFIETIRVNDEFAAKHGNLGPIYGAQWRHWRVGKGIETSLPHPDGGNIYEAGSIYIDQIANLINELKTNPDSRRLMVNSWNVGELGTMVLPPCHYGFQMYTRELSLEERFEYSHNVRGLYYLNRTREQIEEALNYENVPTRAISLMWNQRSVDTALGLPMNIASYALLLVMIADEVNMVPDQLIGNLGDVHLYLDHLEGAKEQITRTPYELPTVHVRDGIDSCMQGDFILKDYQSHPKIYFPLSN